MRRNTQSLGDAQWWTLTSVEDEVAIGKYRIDVAGTHAGRLVWIEVAVTHPVDVAKRDALSVLGTPCLETEVTHIQSEFR